MSAELQIVVEIGPFESVELQAGYYGIPKNKRRTDEILDAVKLSKQKHAYARALSGGMRRRLLIAKAMAHSPPILVLDEPTAGVDVELRKQLWKHVRKLNHSGITVLLTTHYLEEAEELCDQIAIINKGEIIACQPTKQLVGLLDKKDVNLTIQDLPTSIPNPLKQFEISLKPTFCATRTVIRFLDFSIPVLKVEGP